MSVNLKKEKQDQRRAAECCGEESCLRDGVNFIYPVPRKGFARREQHVPQPRGARCHGRWRRCSHSRWRAYCSKCIARADPLVATRVAIHDFDKLVFSTSSTAHPWHFTCQRNPRPSKHAEWHAQPVS